MKETCTRVMLPGDLNDNTVDTKTKEPDKNFKTDPEQDRTSIYSGSDDGVLMTLIQLCRKVVRNRDTKIADENDKQKEKDYKRYTVDVNFKYGAKSVMFHKDICTEANKSVNTKSIIDGLTPHVLHMKSYGI